MAKKSLKKQIEGVERLEKKGLKELKKVEREEAKIESELKKFEGEIEKMHGEIKGGVIEKFTTKDIARGIVGAIFGMSIMGWHERVINAGLNMPAINVFVIFLLTIVAGASVLYFSQYKRIKDTWIIKNLLPKRFVIFYGLCLLVVFVIYALFNIIEPGITPTIKILKLIVVVSLPAMIGASTADIVRF